MLKTDYHDNVVRVSSDAGLKVKRKGHKEAYPAMTFNRDDFIGLDKLEEVNPNE